MHRFKAIVVIASLCLASSAHPHGTPIGSAFTYQGVLQSGGSPASGTYNLRFQLWDALSGGAQIGADIDLPVVSIVDGLFSVELDFGILAFNGEARWLEVKVITNGGSTITPLTPRQPVNATPYALYALTVDGPNITNLNAGNLASGTIPEARLAGTYANALNLTNAANVVAGNGAGLTSLNASNLTTGTIGSGLLNGTYSNTVSFTSVANAFVGSFGGNGAALTGLNATNVASGTLSSARLPSGGAWDLTTNLSVDSNTLVIDQANNRIGIGTAFPAGPLHIAQHPDPNMVLHDTGPASTQTGYLSFRNNALTETGWIGFGNPGSPSFSIVNARSGGHILLAPFNNSSNVGIGTSAPVNRLHVEKPAAEPGAAILGRSTGSVGIRGEGTLAVVGSGTGTGVTASASLFGGIGVRSNGPSGGFDYLAEGSGTDYGSISSIRWKRNIEPIADPLVMLERIRGVYYDWDAEHGGHHDVGMIAEEVGAVLPEIVVYEANGVDAIGMDYSKLTPLLVEAVKALKADNDELRAELAKLRERMQLIPKQEPAQ